MDLRRTFRFNPALGAAVLFVALAAGSIGISSAFTRAQSRQIPSACYDDDAIVGTPADDKLIGTTSDDVIFGGGGRDVIRGKGGNDLICSRGGADLVKGGRGDDSIFGGGADDELRGGPGNDTIKGGPGIDTANGGRDTDDCDAESETNCEEPVTPSPSPTPSATASPTPTPSVTPTTTATPTPTPAAPTSPPQNLKPNAADDGYSTDEDQPLSVPAPGVLGNDSDPENGAMQAMLASGPFNGDVTLNPNGSFDYTPDADFNGADTFTYVAHDGTTPSTPATVTVDVDPMPDQPDGIAQSIDTNEDAFNVVSLFGSDPDGPAPSVFKISSLPTNGDLRDGSGLGGQVIGAADLPYTLSGDQVTYVPDPDYFGSDSFDFKANDGALDSGPAPVEVDVLPMNDAPTDISLSDDSVDEEQAAGTTVGNLTAADGDAGDTHTFSLSAGAGDADNSRFSITNGVLKTAESFDFETQGPFSIRVRAVDAGNQMFEKQFGITLVNVNDKPVVPDATFSLAENSANGTAVGTPSVTDQDAAQTHTWSITAGNSGSAFAIAPSTGAITVADTGELDFEDVQQWVLTVRAEDNGSPAKNDTATVTINLTNLNEAPTDIQLDDASVAENETAGTVVGNLSPIDPDNADTHTWALVAGAGDGDNNRFQITNGVLETAQAFDFETQGPFSIRVQTKDAGNLTYEEVFSISVTNVNDAPVLGAATFAVDENSANGTAVGTASATDADSPAQGLTYSITGGNTLGAFQINQTTGAITVADVSDLDFETNPTFGLTVKAQDDGTPAKDDSETITINLNNLNEKPVVNAATLSLAENSANGTSVGTVTSSDPDAGQTVTYAITGGNTGNAFQINSGTGEITVADTNDVDFESNHPFSLTVEGTDNGSPPLTDAETITVNLTNVNEAPTDISLSDNTAPENAAINTVTGALSGTDPDSGDSSALTFSLVSGAGDTDNSRFNINPSKQLRASEVFDFESQGPFSVRVRATDGGALQYEEVFQIVIEDLNDFPSMNSNTFVIDENSANGTAVGTVSSSDEDAGQTRSYSVTAGNALGAFQINSSTGAITVADSSDVDFEVNPTFTLTVRVADDGSPTLHDDATVTVNLNDVNDNPVVNAATLSLAENSANGTSVGTATATDQDNPAQTLTWAITGGNASGAFAIDSVTGGITVADTGDLDFETTPAFGLTVEATDNGAPNRSGSNTVTVSLTNVNEKAAITAPAAISAEYEVAKAMSGISVSDPDSGNQDITMTLAVLDGTLDLDDSVANGLVAGDVTGNGTDALVITGKTSEINNTLGAANGLTYTSDSGFVGFSDTVAIGTNDGGNTGPGGAQLDTANVTIQFNGPPVATDQTVMTNEDTEKTVTLAGTDPDSDPLTFKVTSLPAAGKLHEGTSSAGTEITAGALPYALPADKVTYVPPLNQNGTSLETFGFKANDGSTDSAAGLVTVDVTAVDDPPVAVNDPVTVLEDAGTTTIDVLANDTDVDGGTKTIASKTNPANGTVAITNAGADLTYTPAANYCNNPPTIPVDTFTYTLAGGSVGTVNVTVTCVDDMPVAVNDSKTMNEDAGATTIDVLTNDTDQDGGPKTVASKTNGTNGTVAITNSGADLTYTPATNYCNSPPGTTLDTFTYTLNGGSVGTVTVTVTCVDDAPVAVNDSATVLEDASATTIDVLANDTDVDGGPKFVDAKSNSTNGGTVTITNAGAHLTYAPPANYCNTPELQPAAGNLVETFTYTLNGTPASVGTVTMTVTCVNDPPTADTETFNGADSALSNFRLDNGTSTAGLDIAPSTLHNVLTGDVDIEGDTVSLVAGADCTGSGPFTCQTDGYDPDGAGGPNPVERGSVVLETDGDFHYTPPPGHVGSDTFDYRVSDGEDQANGIVNINVAGPTTWFVDDTASAGGNGTSAAPFQGFAPLTTAGASNHLDDANDTLFVYEGTYASGIVLENGQKLLGHPHSLDLTDTAGRTHTDLVSGAGTAPAISHAANTVVTLGSGNELQDLALGNGTISLAGTSVGTALVRDTSISNTGGKALDINGGTMDMVFSTLTSNTSSTEAIKLNNAAGSFTAAAGSLQNATNAVVDITGSTQDFTYGGSISDGAGKVISIASTIGGTKDFNGTVTGSSGGTITEPRVNLTNNAGSVIRFDNDLTLNTTTAPAFNATGGGTLHMGSDDNVLTTTTGTPLTVVNTTIGASDLIFDSISSNGAQNGIVLDNTGNVGNLHVTGNPGLDTNDGGTIANTAGGTVTTTSCTKPGSGLPAGVGILLKDTNGVVLNDIVVNGSSNFGLLGHDVNGFTIDDSTFTGTYGDDVNQDEGAAYFCNLTGTVDVSDSVFEGGRENTFSVQTTAGTLDLDVVTSSFETSTAVDAQDALVAQAFNTARMDVDVDGSTFTAARGDLFQYSLNNTAVGDLQLTDSTFTNDHPSIVSGGGGITLGAGGLGSNPTWTYNVTNNDFSGAKGNAVTVTTGKGAGTYTGTISNNRIGKTGQLGTGSVAAHGIALTHQGTGLHKTLILNNQVRQYGDRGIDLSAIDGSPTLRATIQGNSITEPALASNFAGLRVNAGAVASDTPTVCIDMGSLTAALKNSLSTSHTANTRDIQIRSSAASPAWTFPNSNNPFANFAAVASYLEARNNGDGTPVVAESLGGIPAATPTYSGAGTNCL